MPGRIGHDISAPEGRASFHAGNERSLRAETHHLRQEVERLRGELAEAEKWLGQALTCAMYALDEVPWDKVERFLRREELWELAQP